MIVDVVFTRKRIKKSKVGYILYKFVRKKNNGYHQLSTLDVITQSNLLHDDKTEKKDLQPVFWPFKVPNSLKMILVFELTKDEIKVSSN